VDREIRDVLYHSLVPEVATTITPRGKVNITTPSADTLLIEIQARDFVMLRALVNSYLRLLKVITESLRELEEEGELR